MYSSSFTHPLLVPKFTSQVTSISATRVTAEEEAKATAKNVKQATEAENLRAGLVVVPGDHTNCEV